MKDLKSENEKLKTKMKKLYEYQIDPEFVVHNLVELEDRSRRCYLRIDEVKETSNETSEKREEHLEILFKYKLGIEENILIERAHRTKSSSAGKKSKPRTIFCKFHDYKGKNKALQNAKKLMGTNISINEDFSLHTGKSYGKRWNSCEMRVKLLSKLSHYCLSRHEWELYLTSFPILIMPLDKFFIE